MIIIHSSLLLLFLLLFWIAHFIGFKEFMLQGRLIWFELICFVGFIIPSTNMKSQKHKEEANVKTSSEGCKLVMWWVQMIFVASPNLGV